MSVEQQTRTVSGMEMPFKGLVLHLEYIEGKGTKKVFPQGVYFQQVNGWKHSKLDGADDVLANFLDSKSARSIYDRMCDAIKDVRQTGVAAKLVAVATVGIKGHGHPEAKVKEIVDAHVPEFAAVGITVGTCQVTVNLGGRIWSRFLWIEFVDESAAPTDYLPSFGGAALGLEQQTRTVSGMEMPFKGLVLHLKYIEGKGTKKVFPQGVYFQQVNGWKHSKLDGADDVLANFLDSKSARSIYDKMCGAIKDIRQTGAGDKVIAVATVGIKGHGHPEAEVKEIVDAHVPEFAAVGITVGTCQVTVNLGGRVWSRFLWIEFVDESAAPTDYLPSFGGAAMGLENGPTLILHKPL